MTSGDDYLWDPLAAMLAAGHDIGTFTDAHLTSTPRRATRAVPPGGPGDPNAGYLTAVDANTAQQDTARRPRPRLTPRSTTRTRIRGRVGGARACSRAGLCADCLPPDAPSTTVCRVAPGHRGRTRCGSAGSPAPSTLRLGGACRREHRVPAGSDAAAASTEYRMLTPNDGLRRARHARYRHLRVLAGGVCRCRGLFDGRLPRPGEGLRQTRATSWASSPLRPGHIANSPVAPIAWTTATRLEWWTNRSRCAGAEAEVERAAALGRERRGDATEEFPRRIWSSRRSPRRDGCGNVFGPNASGRRLK